MNKYLVFFGCMFNNQGGAYDFHSGHDTLSEAEAVADTLVSEPAAWAHVFDTSSLTIVYETQFGKVVQDA